MANTVVELKGCTRDYGGVRAVEAMDLVIFEGEFLSLLGPSGCGKTTTLNLIAGFVEPTAGRIFIDGEDVTGLPAHLRGLGVVFQSYALFPHLSVFENVAFGLRERRAPSAEIARRVGEAHPAGNLRRRRPALAKPEGHVLEDGQVRKERIGLEDDAETAQVGGQPRHVLAVDENASRRRLHEARDQIERRGLAAA